jgi:glucokinase
MSGGVTEIVTVDIGGTHARFALAQIAADGAITLDEPETLNTSDHASFQTAWEDFRKRKGGSLPSAVTMAVAGPVKHDLIRFTNNPWIIRPPLIEEKLGCTHFTIVNDFAAVAHAAARAPNEQFLHLAGPEEDLPASGTISVVGPWHRAWRGALLPR